MSSFNNNAGSGFSKQRSTFKDPPGQPTNRRGKHSKIKSIGKEVIRVWVKQASVHKYLFKELLIQTSPKVKETESQLSKHGVVAHLLEPVDYQVIREEAHVWGMFIKKPVGTT